MSFQFSPETLLIELDFQIEQEELKILPLEEEIVERNIILSNLPKQLLGGDPSTNTIKQNAINSVARTIRSVRNQIGAIQETITQLLDQRRLLESEITVRQGLSPDTGLPIAPAGITPELQGALQNIINLLNRPVPTTQPQIIVQEQKLPLKELALIGGAVLLLA